MRLLAHAPMCQLPLLVQTWLQYLWDSFYCITLNKHKHHNSNDIILYTLPCHMIIITKVSLLSIYHLRIFTLIWKSGFQFIASKGLKYGLNLIVKLIPIFCFPLYTCYVLQTYYNTKNIGFPSKIMLFPHNVWCKGLNKNKMICKSPIP